VLHGGTLAAMESMKTILPRTPAIIPTNLRPFHRRGGTLDLGYPLFFACEQAVDVWLKGLFRSAKVRVVRYLPQARL